jgi:hypothetical protein
VVAGELVVTARVTTFAVSDRDLEPAKPNAADGCDIGAVEWQPAKQQ